MKPILKTLLIGAVGFGIGYYWPKIKTSVSKTWKEAKEKYTETDVEEIIGDIKKECCDKVEKIEDAAEEVTEKVTTDKEKK